MTMNNRRSSPDRRGQIVRRSPTVFTFGMMAWWDTPSSPLSQKCPVCLAG